ncbi:MAG: hypothetical protein J6W75_02785 [Bacteroidaceae bacterium]|nr:hypothetical protein [Bacteroidaceae bacterium]
MKKIKLLLSLVLSMMAWTGAMAQTDAEYEAALAAMKDGTNYRITTEIGGTKYYVTTAGQLTTVKADGGIFDITKKTGGAFKTTGFRIHGNGTFTNPPLSNNVANLTPGSFSVSTGNNDRDDWERQVLFLNAEGKYAIRSCNTAPATSSWGDAGRTFWTYGIDPVTPQYSYDPAYVWNFEELLASVNVTYEVWDGENKVGSATVIQDANSEVSIPRNLVGLDFNGGYQPKAYYTFTLEEGSTIGDTDCTIKIIRTPANGVVHALTDLSNNKAYTIMCDRGTLLTKDGAIASTSHATLHDAAPANFAIISFEDYYYLYSVADKKFVLNDGSLSDLLAHDTLDAIRMTAQTDPYFLYTFKIDDTTFHGFNTNGTGALNGCVINTWTTPDQGDQYYMIEAADFDPTEALAALDAFFHPAYFVTYVVKDTKGNVLLTSQPQPTTLGAKITTLPNDYHVTFMKYNEVDVTISQQNTTVEFTATWDGPFELSTSISDARWYNMTIRGDYWVAMDDSEPYYPKADKDVTADASQWAFFGNSYAGISVWNKAKGEGWTLTKDGNNVVMREGTYTWTIGKNSDGFTLLETGTASNVVNQNGGASGPLQFWNSGGAFTDNGSTFRVSEVPVNVYFDVTYNGAVVATAQGRGYVGKVPELPASLKRDFMTFEYTDAVTQEGQRINVTATWNDDAPFTIAPDFASAKWQNLAMRKTWYVTSDQKAQDGALLTVNANAVGLVKDAYKWAFIGPDPYHIMLVNKAEGEGKAFIHADNKSQGIPAFASIAEVENTDNLYWNIRKSNSGIENSFLLNVVGTELCINQFGGAGGSVKFWDSANNVGDEGSAFTIFDVPTNFAEFTGSIEEMLTSDVTGYFALNDATKALWSDDYKTNCSYEKYVELQEAIDNEDNWNWPATGYYRIKSANYDGRYISYTEVNGQPMLTAAENPAEDITNIVKLTALGNKKYTVTVGGLNAKAPAQSVQIGLQKTGAEFTAVITKPGTGTFTTGEQFGALHCAGSFDVVGWTADAAASQWIIEDATIDPKVETTITDAGFATLNALWPVAIPDGVTAYVGALQNENKELKLTALTGTIPAATPVILEGAAGNYTFNFADDVDAVENALKGTYQAAKPEGALTLQIVDETLGFYTFNGESIAANKAYLVLPSESNVKIVFGDATAIKNLQIAGENNVIFNLAGQRINKAQKGIYIINGKKAVVK